ncbi:MAG TPA: beta-ketoacyl-[acyl-carrier-protein] synthase family protein [Chitinispirillaceae bacterium]|nr:beta-ketoacyl-[acyl-carrier-protein] synthase family protein [Chitinispirillaceae bacterium]
MQKESVLIAGMGAVSASGCGVDPLFNAVTAGYDGLKPLTSIDTLLKVTPLCAEITFHHEYFDRYYRTLALALIAVDEALSCLESREGLRIGVVAATTVGGICVTERIYKQIRTNPEDLSSLVPQLSVHEPSVLSAKICEYSKGAGFHTLSTACSTGLHVLGVGKRFVEQGVYDACLVVGADPLSLLTLRGFASLTLLDPRGCRPFDRDRAGISLGEGAAAMLLIPERLAEQCVRKPVVTMAGWGASADCFHMTAPHPQGDGARRAVTAALKESGLSNDSIQLIAAHGTGTPDNDKAEIAAMRTLFDPLPPFFSVKRTIGHTLAASGLLEAVCAAKVIETQRVPKTAGFSTIDEQIGAAPDSTVTGKITSVLKNSFGFGGNNASIIFSGWGN